MPEWLFSLASPAGVDDADLTDCSGLSIDWQRAKRSPVLTGSVPLESDLAASLAAHLDSGIPILSGWRDGQLRFRGLWMPMQETGGEDTGDMALQFAPHARLDGGQNTGRFTDATFTAEEQCQIAADLITQANTASPTGLRAGTVAATGVQRDRTYADQLVMDAIEQLAALDDGFDFEFVAVDEGAVVAKLETFAKQGADKTQQVVFEYGPGTIANVESVTRQTLPPINRAVSIGEPDDSGQVLRGVAQDLTSQNLFGLYEKREQATDGTVEQATLDANAAAMLQPLPVRVVSFQPAPDSFSPWDDFWLGDLVSLRVAYFAMAFTVTPRINQITVQPYGDGESGRETVTIGVDQAQDALT